MKVKTIAILHTHHTPGCLVVSVIADVQGRGPHGEHVRPIIVFPVASTTTTDVQMVPQHILVGVLIVVAIVIARFLEIDLYLSDL